MFANIYLIFFRFQAQISALTHERDQLHQNQKSSDKNEGQKLIKLQRLKTQLEQKVYFYYVVDILLGA